MPPARAASTRASLLSAEKKGGAAIATSFTAVPTYASAAARSSLISSESSRTASARLPSEVSSATVPVLEGQAANFHCFRICSIAGSSNRRPSIARRSVAECRGFLTACAAAASPTRGSPSANATQVGVERPPCSFATTWTVPCRTTAKRHAVLPRSRPSVAIERRGAT
eukprot:scaffold139825_cov33-Tisochrysis_lutea.AAC.1